MTEVQLLFSVCVSTKKRLAYLHVAQFSSAFLSVLCELEKKRLACLNMAYFY